MQLFRRNIRLLNKAFQFGFNRVLFKLLTVTYSLPQNKIQEFKKQISNSRLLTLGLISPKNYGSRLMIDFKLKIFPFC